MATSDRQPTTGDYGADWVYAGFWIRVWASVIDTILLAIVLWPLVAWLAPEPTTSSARIFTGQGTLDIHALTFNTSLASSGPMDILVNWLLPAAVIIVFWIYRSATPGKMLIGARIVDARTGQAARTRQLIVRYAGYYVSAIIFMLGFIWVGLDRRKQGWHDKLAGTVVIRRARTGRPGRDFSSTDQPE